MLAIPSYKENTFDIPKDKKIKNSFSSSESFNPASVCVLWTFAQLFPLLCGFERKAIKQQRGLK